MQVACDFASREFDEAVSAAGQHAFESTLEAGLPVFYREDEGFDVVEYPGGKRFEICWIPGAPSGKNFRILREVNSRTA